LKYLIHTFALHQTSGARVMKTKKLGWIMAVEQPLNYESRSTYDFLCEDWTYLWTHYWNYPLLPTWRQLGSW
jgi:hypothetical protein